MLYGQWDNAVRDSMLATNAIQEFEKIKSLQEQKSKQSLHKQLQDWEQERKGLEEESRRREETHLKAMEEQKARFEAEIEQLHQQAQREAAQQKARHDAELAQLQQLRQKQQNQSQLHKLNQEYTTLDKKRQEFQTKLLAKLNLSTNLTPQQIQNAYVSFSQNNKSIASGANSEIQKLYTDWVTMYNNASTVATQYHNLLNTINNPQ